jgi:hypothetical protein
MDASEDPLDDLRRGACRDVEGGRCVPQSMRCEAMKASGGNGRQPCAGAEVRGSYRRPAGSGEDVVVGPKPRRCGQPARHRASSAVAQGAGADLEYLVLADSVLVLQGQHDVVVITDDREAQVGHDHRALMDSLPAGSPDHTRAHRAYVEALRSYRDRTGGFWVASIDPAVSQEGLVLQPEFVMLG